MGRKVSVFSQSLTHVLGGVVSLAIEFWSHEAGRLAYIHLQPAEH